MAAVRSQLNRSRIRWAWLFLAPMLVALFLVAFYPLAMTFFYSLFDVRTSDLQLADPQTGESYFFGLRNYWRILFDTSYPEFFSLSWWRTSAWWQADWWGALKNTFIFAIGSVSLELVFGMIVALILNVNFKGRGWMRAAILVPWALPTVVSAKMWSWILDTENGIMNDLLTKLHIIKDNINWIGNDFWSMVAIIGVDAWKTTPFMALLILAALQTVPESMYEAARVDGVSKWNQFWYLTLPVIKPAVIVALIFRTLDALRVFDLIYVLTANSRSTMSVSVLARKTLMEDQYFGRGSAASVLIFILVGVIAIIYLKLGRVKLTEGGK
ncbi:MAG: carbohydrate ABC transporter permease [Alphaproteobacteria bacterium]